MCALLRQPPKAIRGMWYRNLAALAQSAGVAPRMPTNIRAILSGI
jgi:hypothetical protein